MDNCFMSNITIFKDIFFKVKSILKKKNRKKILISVKQKNFHEGISIETKKLKTCHKLIKDY